MQEQKERTFARSGLSSGDGHSADLFVSGVGRFCTVSDAARSNPPMDAASLSAYQELLHSGLVSLSPGFLRRRYLVGHCYPYGSWAADVAEKLKPLLAGFYVGVFAFGYLVSGVILAAGRWTGRRASWTLLCLALLVGALLSLRRWDWPLSHAVIAAYAFGIADCALVMTLVVHRRRTAADVSATASPGGIDPP
ncbi:MAG: hypothetical protein ACUVTZ_00735 [Armatimonadota bacterium]